jgi:integrase
VDGKTLCDSADGPDTPAGRTTPPPTLADICKRRLNFSAVHQIRHTFAKELEERGVKPSEIQRRLGHQSLRTTTIYLGRLSSAENSVSEAMADDLGIE